MKKHSILFGTIFVGFSTGLLASCNTVDDVHTISFYDDATLIGQVQTAGRERISLPEAPEKDRYEFMGWYLDRGVWAERLTSETFLEEPLLHDISSYAYYRESAVPAPTEHAIRFFVDGALYDTILTAGNETLVLPEDPQKEDFRFAGWFFDEGTYLLPFDETTYASTALSEDVSVYASFTAIEDGPKEYRVTFETDGGSEVAPVVASVIETEPVTTKEGHTFRGWYTEDELLHKVSFPYAVTKDQTLYAGWEKNAYDVHFELNGGTGVEDVHTDRIETEPIPTREGYTFLGWYKEEDLLQRISFPYEVTENQTLYAGWEKNTYRVHFELNGGTGVEDVVTDRIETEPVPTKEGYRFLGWYEESSLIHRVTFPLEVTRGQTLYAGWERITYRVHFELNGGTGVEDIVTASIETEPVPTKEGATFLGWFTEPELVHMVTFPYEVTKDQTLYAGWEEIVETELKFTVDSEGVLTSVEGIDEQHAEVEVPSQVDGIVVKEIGQKVFANNVHLRKLVLPDTVALLGHQMCYGCTSLTEVVLPDAVTTIPDYAFEKCTSLTTINVPSSLEVIRSEAFSETALKEFVAPDSFREIWSYAFQDCKDLERVELNRTESIGSMAFENCEKLSSIRLPEELNSVGTFAFSGCHSLTDISMPSRPVAVPNSLFYDTGYANDPQNWDQGVLSVDGYLLRCNEDLLDQTRYVVPEGTIVIAENAFQNYGKTIASLVLPEGLQLIGKSAFSGMSALKDVSLPDTIRSIGYDAFDSTGIAGDSSRWEGNGLYVGNWLVAVENTKLTEFAVREGTIGIADGKDTSLFPTRAQSIQTLTLPSTLKYVGVRSFARLKITELTLPSSLETIGEGGFKSCSFLKSVNLEDCTNLRSIGSLAFSEAALSEVTIPESVETMGELVFNHNTVDLLVRCQAKEKPSGWDDDWSFSYRQGVTITVEWKSN